MNHKKVLYWLAVIYTLALNLLLFVHFSINDFPSSDKAVLGMGFTLFIVWVVLGGSLQYRLRGLWNSYVLSKKVTSPLLFFVLSTTLFACFEEAITTLLTNLAPLYGSAIGEAYITASTNFIRVITLHSVIVFIPMFVVLGYLLRKYQVSPFGASVLFGLVGMFAEMMFGGSQVIYNAPAWICIYGLMVYLPSHIFTHKERKPIATLLMIFWIPLILASASLTAWIPAVLNVPRIEF